PGRASARLVGPDRLSTRGAGAGRARWWPDRQRRPVRLLLPRRAARAGRGGVEQGARTSVAGLDGVAVDARRVAGRACPVRPVHGGSLLPARLPPPRGR